MTILKRMFHLKDSFPTSNFGITLFLEAESGQILTHHDRKLSAGNNNSYGLPLEIANPGFWLSLC